MKSKREGGGMVIAIANQKGGVGKSTTALALTASLAKRGKRVLIVDADAQGNTTTVAGGDGKPDLFDVLTGEASAAEAARPTKAAVTNDNLFGADIIPAGRGLASADVKITDIGKEYLLRDALQPVGGDYDFILVDTPPHIGVLIANALTAADAVIIPATAEAFGLQGVTQLKPTLDNIRKHCNPNLKILGILLTRHRTNTRLMGKLGELAGEVAAKMGTVVYSAKIRESVAVKEAQAERRPLQDYAAGAAADYEAFTEELLTQVGRLK